MNDINQIINSIKQSAINFIISRDYDTAIEELKRAEIIDRDNPEILYNLAISYSRKGLYKTAYDYFKKVLLLHISFIDNMHVKKNIAYCLINMHEYDKALEYIHEILKSSDEDIYALNMRGYCLEQKGLFRDALKTYREVFRYDKSNINSLNSAAYLMAKLEIELKSALKISKFVYRKDPSNPAYNDTLGYIYMKLGKYKEAERYLTHALEILPFNKEIHEHNNELNHLRK